MKFEEFFKDGVIPFNLNDNDYFKPTFTINNYYKIYDGHVDYSFVCFEFRNVYEHSPKLPDTIEIENMYIMPISISFQKKNSLYAKCDTIKVVLNNCEIIVEHL